MLLDFPNSHDKRVKREGPILIRFDTHLNHQCQFERIWKTIFFVFVANICICNCIGGVMVRMPTSRVVDHGFEPRLGQTKDYKIGICRFSTKHTALRRKSKDWLAWYHNQDNVSEWGDMTSSSLVYSNTS
jgi:hypothetical protein